MGVAKKENEKQEEKILHTNQFCERCGEELTEADLEFIKKFGEPKNCSRCRKEKDNIQKQ